MDGLFQNRCRRLEPSQAPLCGSHLGVAQQVFAKSASLEFQKACRDYFSARQEDTVASAGESFGVITAVDSRYFPALLWWWEAVKQNCSTSDVLVFDLGLTSPQRKTAELAGVRMQQADPACFDHIYRETIVKSIPFRELCCWTKPFLLRDSPFANNLWIDVDALVIRPIPELETMVGTRPFATLEQYNPAWSKNHPELSRLLPLPQPASDLAINNGVFGLNPARDHQLFDWWVHAVYAALRDPAVRAQVQCWDQGCMLWALQKTGRSDIVLSEPFRYNCPANFKTASTVGERKRYQGTDFFNQLREDHPGVSIVHWMGAQGKLECWPGVAA